MDIRKKYTEETGKLYFNEEDYNVGWDDDYVHWLEDNLVKLFTTPDVSNSVCSCNSSNYGYGAAKCFDCGKLKEFKQTDC